LFFEDRDDAGKVLAETVAEKYLGEDVIVLALPHGGVPVGYHVAKRLNAPFDVLVVRKLPIPWNTEAGFGAITMDGALILNESLVACLGLSKEDIRSIADEVLKEIRWRSKIYRGDKPFPELKGKVVILVDDGLASGFTMLAAAKSIEKYAPAKKVVAIPCSPESSINLLKPYVDVVICLVVQKYFPFAVASFYKRWWDLSEEEVLSYLKRS
jgi:putative phosphoribosyl transferase